MLAAIGLRCALPDLAAVALLLTHAQGRMAVVLLAALLFVLPQDALLVILAPVESELHVGLEASDRSVNQQDNSCPRQAV